MIRRAIAVALGAGLALGCSDGRKVYVPAGGDMGPILVHTEPVVVQDVKLGQGRFSRRVLVEDRGIGWVDEIIRGGDKGPAVAWGVVGTQMAFFVDENGKPVTRVLFEPRPYPRYPHHALDADGDGLVEFAEENLGGLVLRGHLGAVRWSHPLTGSGGCAPGDLDGDGKGEIACAQPGAIVVLDGAEQLRWSSPTADKVAQARITRDRQVVTLEGSSVVVRDRRGKIVSRKTPSLPGPFGNFALAPYPKRDAPERIAVVRDGKLQLLGLDGAAVAALPLPSEIYDPVAATPVAIGDAGALFFAAIAALPDVTHPRVALLLWDAGGQLAYHEIIAGGGGALLAAPDGGGEKLLVGGGAGTVWEYRRAK